MPYADPEKQKQVQREWYQKNKVKLAPRYKAWKLAHPELIRSYRRRECRRPRFNFKKMGLDFCWGTRDIWHAKRNYGDLWELRLLLNLIEAKIRERLDNGEGIKRNAMEMLKRFKQGKS